MIRTFLRATMIEYADRRHFDIESVSAFDAIHDYVLLAGLIYLMPFLAAVRAA